MHHNDGQHWRLATHGHVSVPGGWTLYILVAVLGVQFQGFLWVCKFQVHIIPSMRMAVTSIQKKPEYRSLILCVWSEQALANPMFSPAWTQFRMCEGHLLHPNEYSYSNSYLFCKHGKSVIKRKSIVWGDLLCVMANWLAQLWCCFVHQAAIQETRLPPQCPTENTSLTTDGALHHLSPNLMSPVVCKMVSYFRHNGGACSIVHAPSTSL